MVKASACEINFVIIISSSSSSEEVEEMTSTHATFARLVGRTATAPKSFDEFREVMMDGSSRSVVYTSDKAMSSVKELVQLEEAVRATSVQKLT